jgi:hypothetical protein
MSVVAVPMVLALFLRSRMRTAPATVAANATPSKERKDRRQSRKRRR